VDFAGRGGHFAPEEGGEDGEDDEEEEEEEEEATAEKSVGKKRPLVSGGSEKVSAEKRSKEEVSS
jgi:hypothetical protein